MEIFDEESNYCNGKKIKIKSRKNPVLNCFNNELSSIIGHVFSCNPEGLQGFAEIYFVVL